MKAWRVSVITAVKNELDNITHRNPSTADVCTSCSTTEQHYMCFFFCLLLTQEYLAPDRLWQCTALLAAVCARLAGCSSHCTLCWDEEPNAHVCACLLFRLVHVCLCASVGHSRLMLADTCGSLISTRSRDSQQNLHTQVSMATTKIIFPSSPGKLEIPRCWNAQIHCHYLAASYLTGLGFFCLLLSHCSVLPTHVI